MDSAEYWFAAAWIALAGAVGFVRGFRWWRWARLIEDTPTSRVRSAAQGYVELVGTGRNMPGAPVIAPLSRLPCTWWRHSIERLVRDNKGRAKWRVVSKGASDALFLLEDDTGQCIVDPDGAEVLPAKADTWFGSTPLPEAGPPASRGFRGFGSEFRYREWRMHAGDPLYAIGWFRTEGGVLPGTLDTEIVALLREWKKDQAALLARFDADGDGVLTLAEWEKARAAAHEQVTEDRLRQAAAPGVHVLGRPAADGRPFLLAASDAGRLARRYRWRASGGLALFLIAVTALAWLLLGSA